MTTTSGSAKWQGGIKDGKGAISTKSGALKRLSLRLCQPLRRQARLQPGRTDRRGACRLLHHGAVADPWRSQADRRADGNQGRRHAGESQGDGFAITSVHLTLTAKIPGADKAKFDELTAMAKAGCPVSKLLNTKITLDATLCAE